MNTSTRAALAAAALLVSCGRQHDPAPRSEPTVSPALELSGLVDRVHLPYAETPAGFTGGHETYAVAAGRDGAFVVTPNAVTAAGEGADGTVAPLASAPAPARIETVAIARGEDLVASGPGTALLAGDGSLLVARGDVLEHLANGAAGVEQSWTFPEPPLGRGDVTVRVRVGGLEPAGETAGGLHFTDPATGVGLRYGRATWIDALGSATDVPARLEGDEIVLEVPASVVDGSLYPAILDPIISPEIGLDEPVSVMPLGFVRAATDGTSSFVAWIEGAAPNGRVLGVRVGPDGALLDATPVVLGSGASLPLAVAWGDGVYLVAWASSGTTAYTRVSSATGAMLDSGSRLMPDGARSVGNLAFDGAAFVAAARTSSSYSAFRIATTGDVLQQLPIAGFSGANVSSLMGTACSRQHCVATWNEVFNATCSSLGCTGGTLYVRGALVDPTWTGAARFDLATGGTAASTRPSAVANEDGFLVVWADDSAGENDVYGSWIPFDGLRAHNRIPISRVAGPQNFPFAAYDGRSFVVAWRDGRNAQNDIYAARVTPGGTVLDPAGVLVAPSSMYFGVTPAAGGALATWTDAFGVHGRPLADGGASGLHAVREVTVPGPALTDVPMPVFTGSEYLLTWSEANAILSARVDAAGEPIGDRFTSFTIPAYSVAGHVARTNGASVLVVAWDGTSSANIFGQLLGLDGLPIGPQFVVASGVPLYGTVRVGASGSDYLLTWAENTTPRVIRAIRYAGDGTPIDAAPFVLAGADGVPVQNPLATPVADGWVVPYMRGAPSFSSTGASDLYAIHVPLRDAPGTAYALVTAAGDQGFPAIHARGAAPPLLVWQDFRDPAGVHLRFARLTADRSALDGGEKILTPPLGSGTAFAFAAFDGVNTIVIWSRSSTTPGLYGARIDAADTVLDPSSVVLEPGAITTGLGQRWATTDAAGHLFVAYRNAEGEVRIRLFEDAPASATATLDPGTAFTIAAAKANDESVPQVASDGTGFFVVWRDTRGFADATGVQGQVYGLRVSATGTPLDAKAIALSSESSTARNPTVRFDGSNYFVAWLDTYDGTYYGRRVSPLGLVLDASPLVLATGISAHPGYPVMLHPGPTGHFLVTWTQSASSPELVTSRARWVAHDGYNVVALGEPFDVAPAPSYGGSAAFLGGRWLLAHVTGVPGSGLADVHGRWVAQDGVPGESFAIATAGGDQLHPSAAHDGRQFLVTYQDRTHIPAGATSAVRQLHAVRIGPDGALLDGSGKRLFPTDFNQTHAHASWEGRDWYVSWLEDRTSTVGTGTATLYGARMTADLTVRDALGTALGSEAIPVAVRGQATNGAGVLLLAHHRKDAALGVNRAVARVVTTWVPLAIAATGTGTGTVQLSTGGECRGDCTKTFDPGTRVSLTPSADAGSVFTGWSGACSGTGTCTLTLGSPARATARFDLPDQVPTYALDVFTGGTAPGSIAVDPLPDASGYVAGTIVTATAVPGADARFSGWSGACQGTGGCIVVMDGPKSLAALFDAGAPTSSALPVTVTPATAPVDGGTLLTITGDRFAPGTVVTIGSATAAVQGIEASNRLTAFSPTVVAAGPADVRIQNPDGSVLTLPAGFTFYVPGTNTPSGEHVTVAADRTYTFAPDTSLRFEGITAPGSTTVSAPLVDPPAPTNFAVLGGTNGPKYLEISTSATFTGKIEIAVKYDPRALGLTPEQEARLRLLHYACTPAGECAWEDATEVANPHDPPYTDAHPQYFGRFSPPFVNPDTKNHVIYGVTTSLSPFALADGGGTTRTIIAQVWGDGTGWISGPGIDCGAGREQCVTSVAATDPPQTVTLEAQPASGSLFKTWAGSCSGTAPCTLTMNMDRFVLAHFVPSRFPVSVQTWGAGAGRVDAAIGIACQSGSATGCSALVDNTTPPQKVTLTATAGADSKFAGWAPPCVSTTNTCTLEVRSPLFVAARFEPTGFPVKVSALGTGRGTVHTPAGTCRADAPAGCAFTVPNETPAREVTVTAEPDADAFFGGWSGACQGTSTTCTFPAVGTMTVNAAFHPKSLPLSASPTGPGRGRVTGGGLDCATGPTGTCTVQVPNEQPPRLVALTATPDAGSLFAYWAGACGGTGACEVTVDAARTAIAVFEPDHWPLEVQLWGSGAGRVTGPGIDCSRAAGAVCDATIANTDPATKVTLTATAQTGSVLAGWEGACVVDGSSCTVEMASARSVAAKFEPAPSP